MYTQINIYLSTSKYLAIEHSITGYLLSISKVSNSNYNFSNTSSYIPTDLVEFRDITRQIWNPPWIKWELKILNKKWIVLKGLKIMVVSICVIAWKIAWLSRHIQNLLSSHIMA